MKDVGEKIRLHRLAKNYSQEYMAFMLEISQPAYSKIERDATELTIQRVFDIAEILEINPFILLPKPKHGSGINLAYNRIILKLRKVFRRTSASKIHDKKQSYNNLQGQTK